MTTIRPNIHPITNVRYGVLCLRGIDSDVSSDLMFQNGIDTNYIEAMISRINSTDIEFNSDANDNENTYQYWDRIQKELEALDYDWYDFHEEYQDFTGDVYACQMDGVTCIVNNNDNVLMVLESPVIVNAALCSPCYPNAGDLDNLDEDGYETYFVPDSWFIEEFM